MIFDISGYKRGKVSANSLFPEHPWTNLDLSREIKFWREKHEKQRILRFPPWNIRYFSSNLTKTPSFLRNRREISKTSPISWIEGVLPFWDLQIVRFERLPSSHSGERKAPPRFLKSWRRKSRGQIREKRVFSLEKRFFDPRNGEIDPEPPKQGFSLKKGVFHSVWRIRRSFPHKNM